MESFQCLGAKENNPEDSCFAWIFSGFAMFVATLFGSFLLYLFGGLTMMDKPPLFFFEVMLKNQGCMNFYRNNDGFIAPSYIQWWLQWWLYTSTCFQVMFIPQTCLFLPVQLGQAGSNLQILSVKNMTYTTSPGSGQVRPSVSQVVRFRFVWDAPGTLPPIMEVVKNGSFHY